MYGIATFNPSDHRIFQANIGKRATHHHFVVATTGAIRIEVDRLYPVSNQILTSGGGFGDVTGRRDMVGGDAVTQQCQGIGAMNRTQRRHFFGHTSEVGWVLDVGRSVVPGIQRPLWHRQLVPNLVAGKDIAVLGAEQISVEGGIEGSLDFGFGWPNICQIDRLAIAAQAQRLVVDVDIDGTSNREGHYQRR